jgi:hypothetical protein
LTNGKRRKSCAGITLKPDGDAKLEFVDVFKEIWDILDPALKYAVAMEKTNEATDKVLNEVWASGNTIANGGGASAQSEFIQKFCKIWDKLEKALQILQLVVNDKADATIDDILEIGDWIADGGND